MISVSRRFLTCPIFVIILCFVLATCKSTRKADTDAHTAFLQWFTRNGGKYHGISLIETESMGRGVFADQNVLEGDKLIEVSKNMVICTEMVKHSQDIIHKEIYRLFHLRSEEELLIAFILTEISRGMKSVWKPYLDVLPKTITNLLSFNTDELKMLQDEQLQQEATRFNDQINRNYHTFLEVVSGSSNILSTEKLDIHSISKDVYFWAQAVLDSRGLRFQGRIHLAPFCDMFNYYPHQQMRENLSGDFFLKYHYFDSTSSLVVLADRDHKQGQEIYEDYGDNDDSIYLQYHGFVADKNPFRCLPINIHASNELKNNEMAVDILRRLRVRPSMAICISETSKIPDGVLLLNIVETMKTTEQLISCRNDVDIKIKAQASMDTALEACSFRSILNTIHHHYERGTTAADNNNNNNDNDYELNLVNATMERIKHEIENSVDRYKNFRLTTLKEDESTLETLSSLASTSKWSSDQYKQYIAVKYRYNRKLFIQNIFNKFHIEMNLLDANSNHDGNDNDSDNNNINSNNNDNSSHHERDRILKESIPSMEERVSLFNEWYNNSCDSGVTKIIAKSHPLFRVSTYATTTIDKEELYLGVPTSIIIGADVAYNDKEFGVLLKSLSEKFNYRDNFHELLLYLLHQRFMIGPNSKYWPYLLLLPHYNEMNLPLFWTEIETERRIGPSGIKTSVVNYSKRYHTSYEQIMQIDMIKSFFPKDVLTLENYLWGVAILDSRSIWWENQRHLVPLLDLINCQNSPENDPSTSYRVHSTQLSNDRKYAITNASYKLKSGDELFENYGQPNHIYFMYHGFILQHNSYDCVQISLEMSDDEIKAVEWNKARDIAKSLGLRNDRRPSYSTCLNYPIDSKVWRFLSIKMNTYEKRKSMNTIDQPSVQAAKLLHTITSNIELEYDQFDYSHDDHEASIKFLLSEKSLLTDINFGLNALIRNLSFTNSDDVTAATTASEIGGKVADEL